MSFFENLKNALSQNNMTMTDLANSTGITYNMIKKYCADNAEPTVSYALKMAKELNTTRQTVRTVLADYESRGAKDTAYRKVRKNKFSEDQAQSIIRLLDEEPSNGRKWTVPALAKAAMERGIAESISTTAIQRILISHEIVL